MEKIVIGACLAVAMVALLWRLYTNIEPWEDEQDVFDHESAAKRRRRAASRLARRARRVRRKRR